MKSTSNRALYLRILGEIRPHWHVVAISIVCLAVAAAVDAGLPLLLKPLLDQNLKPSTLTDNVAWLLPAQILGLALLRLISNFGNEYTTAWVSSRVMHDLRSKMFSRMLSLPVKYFDQTSVGVLLSRVTFDVNQIMDAGTKVLTVLVKDSLLLVFLLVSMLLLDWQLTLLCLILLPGVAISISVAGKRQRRLSRETQAAMGKMTQILDESLSGQRIIKIFGGFSYETTRFGQTNNNVRRLSIKQAITSSMNSGLIMFLIGVTLAVIIYYASLRAQDGLLTAGSFVAFMIQMMMLQQPIKNLTKVNESLHKGLAAGESVFAILDQPIEPNQGQLQSPRVKGAISLQDIHFSYDDEDKQALDGISLDIQPGETIALVGSSGSGKTTLANLLPRFYDVSSGQILIDQQPLTDYQLGNLRQQIALVSQDVVLFNDSVTANIAYGSEIDMERVRQAAKAAHALEFIDAMPEGLNTLLGENGMRLSGGQRQRLAIARAIYKDAPILILDEATSALDTESERKVQDALENLMQGRTTLVIAHRLSTIENASRIVVMQQGKIVESGTHQTLMANNGMYCRMHAAQFANA
ncbi:lipid A export permease/ATP-binding protein MsbA [Iodobacter fluviatilis]|uniref:Lipid A export ATP-binding/permease protein MsbA n=1 Tax=Iodobacter fluviatilis TaxID=537 RepID=A0A377SXU1_9NEIS|nr:lipid A export permease/ATP-binding protein MsbA [Iodobacter fluviatilis]TCU82954.1 subfamily B ATP-binding cassette protein MsbA [Iodobacter fluviatilis]STR45777.1 Lipid A export ATP-binding/permease protein MsbA [Iodobacter fluviatilis]